MTAIATMLHDRPTIAERVIETGTRGEGGDRTLEIDEAAEDVVFAELELLHDAGARFTAVSEERGVVDFGSDALLVVIDPIDGSLNAKRGLPHHALSIAVADGPTMADVFFGFVQDFGPEEEWLARRGERGVARRRAARHRARWSAATGAASSRSWASSRPIRAGWCSRWTRWRRPRTGSARSARSRSRCARSRPPASTRWPR